MNEASIRNLTVNELIRVIETESSPTSKLFSSALLQAFYKLKTEYEDELNKLIIENDILIRDMESLKDELEIYKKLL